jgi:hypothetical protein
MAEIFNLIDATPHETWLAFLTVCSFLAWRADSA